MNNRNAGWVSKEFGVLYNINYSWKGFELLWNWKKVINKKKQENGHHTNHYICGQTIEHEHKLVGTKGKSDQQCSEWKWNYTMFFLEMLVTRELQIETIIVV